MTIDSDIEERFNSFYYTNFKSILDSEMIESNFPNIWNIETERHS